MAERAEAPLAMTADEVAAFIAREFPQADAGFSILSVRPRGAVVSLAYEDRHLRPGGTLSGPSMMALADFTAYVAILAQLGPVALAVTTNLTINFLRRPQQTTLIADCELIKLGQRLAVGEVGLCSEGDPALVAHAVTTYALPPTALR
jgi:uncharacterized protein (TIGR00369 family)